MKRLISVLLIFACMLSQAACGDNGSDAVNGKFPDFEGVDFGGRTITNDIFKDYDVTVINFWINSCGSCIAEMPELEEYYKKFKTQNINLIAVAASAGDSEMMRSLSEKIIKENGITYTNIIPNINSEFYKDFICEFTGFPITYVVDGSGNIIGAPIMGVVSKQEKLLMKRIDKIKSGLGE